MSRNYYSEINLYITWHCKESAPMLVGDVEAVVRRTIKGQLLNAAGVFVHAIGGTDTHIHIAVTIPPTVMISGFVGQLKGFTSHTVNQQFALRGKAIQWQPGYGVVRFGTKDLPWVKRYIQCQRSHHASGGIVDRLEQISEIETSQPNRSPVNGADYPVE